MPQAVDDRTSGRHIPRPEAPQFGAYLAMDVFHGTATLDRALREPVVAIGNFDGVHRGHAALIDLAVTQASARGGEAVVLTFEPHPARVLAPGLAPPLLTSLERKLALLAARGVGATVIEPFTRELAGHTAAAFVEETLCKRLGMREVVVGFDFTYGAQRLGNVATLGAAAGVHRFKVHVVAPLAVDGLVASSTKIREFVLEGNVAGAALLLGRAFDVEGTVMRGAGRGRGLGVPTANVAVEGELCPRPGVYTVTLTRLDAAGTPVHDAVANLGTNPTFARAGASGALSLEAHLLDWDGDLYGQRVRVAFHGRLRDEQRFSSAAALVTQIHADIQEARRRFGTTA